MKNAANKLLQSGQRSVKNLSDKLSASYIRANRVTQCSSISTNSTEMSHATTRRTLAPTTAEQLVTGFQGSRASTPAVSRMQAHLQSLNSVSTDQAILDISSGMAQVSIVKKRVSDGDFCRKCKVVSA